MEVCVILVLNCNTNTQDKREDRQCSERMFFLRQLRKFNMPRKVMVEFYTAIIESILTSSITVWFAASTAKDKGSLQRVIRSAEKVIAVTCRLS